MKIERDNFKTFYTPVVSPNGKNVAFFYSSINEPTKIMCVVYQINPGIVTSKKLEMNKIGKN